MLKELLERNLCKQGTVFLSQLLISSLKYFSWNLAIIATYLQQAILAVPAINTALIRVSS